MNYDSEDQPEAGQAPAGFGENINEPTSEDRTPVGFAQDVSASPQNKQDDPTIKGARAQARALPHNQPTGAPATADGSGQKPPAEPPAPPAQGAPPSVRPNRLARATKAAATAQEIREEGVGEYAKRVATDKAKSKASQFLLQQLAKRGLNVVSGPLGWVVLGIDILKSKTIRRIILWSGVVILILAIFPFLLVLVFKQSKSHYGPDISGGVNRTALVSKSVPAQVSKDKGQLVVTGLASIDQSIEGAEKIVAKNSSLARSGPVGASLNALEALKTETESKAFADSRVVAEQLKKYRQILADLAVALDDDAAANQASLKTAIKNSDGMTIGEAHTCAPGRDIDNFAISGKMFQSLIKIGQAAKAAGLTAQLTCLVTGYRDTTEARAIDAPDCLSTENKNPSLTPRQHTIATHCNGRGADFGGDFKPLYDIALAKSDELGLSAVLDAQDHLHIEVLP